MPARRTSGPHVHGYALTPECLDPLCRAMWRGYMRGRRSVLRERREASRNAATIEALRTAPGPVLRRRQA